MKRYIPIIFVLVIVVVLPVSFIEKEKASKEELGKLLFFDPILSKDHSISCAHVGKTVIKICVVWLSTGFFQIG